MCALVKGMTDILTPVNILTNSDFSRSHGHGSVTTIASLANTKTVEIAEGWLVRAFNANFTDITITINEGSITAEFTSDAIGSNVALGIVQAYQYMPTKYIRTTTAKFNNFTNVERCQCDMEGTRAILYNKVVTPDSSDNTAVKITSNGSGGSYYEVVRIYPKTANTVTRATAYELAVYIGSFCNPPNPTIPSLDVMPGHQFMLRDDLDYLSTNACLCKYMATAVDTSSALTTTGCIKDISGNGHHTQCSSSYLATIPYLTGEGKVIQSTSTSTAAYTFNCPQLGLPVLNNDGDYDEMTIFTRFKYQTRASTSNKGSAVGLEWTYSPGNGQDSRANYFYIRTDQSKIGINLSTLTSPTAFMIATLVSDYTYAIMFSISFTKGLRNIYVYDITNNQYSYSSSISIKTKAEGNGWKLTGGASSSSNYPAKAFLCSSADALIMESAMYSCFMNRDNFNYLVDNYHPEIGAAFLGA